MEFKQLKTTTIKNGKIALEDVFTDPVTIWRVYGECWKRKAYDRPAEMTKSTFERQPYGDGKWEEFREYWTVKWSNGTVTHYLYIYRFCCNERKIKKEEN